MSKDDHPITRSPDHPITPDGRYFVVHGRLWGRLDPSLPEESRTGLVADLGQVRRAVGVGLRLDDADKGAVARAAGNRQGSIRRARCVWWDDGAPDLNRRMVAGTPNAE